MPCMACDPRYVSRVFVPGRNTIQILNKGFDPLPYMTGCRIPKRIPRWVGWELYDVVDLVTSHLVSLTVPQY